MLKVNLETELLKQNKSLVSSRDLLLIREYDTLGDSIVSEQSLVRVFGETSAAQGKRVKDRVETLLQQTNQFDQSRVFHISQIEKLCIKYHLRFLPSSIYKGAIDKETAQKINQFEIANNVVCGGWKKEYDYRFTHQRGGNTYIAAPASSFELQQKPKDPLLFFQINSEYFYLIHKWGNDLNIVRRIYRFLTNKITSWCLTFLPVIAISIFLVSNNVSKDSDGDPVLYGWGIVGVTVLVVSAITSLFYLVEGEPLIKKSEWRSEFE